MGCASDTTWFSLRYIQKNLLSTFQSEEQQNDSCNKNGKP